MVAFPRNRYDPLEFVRGIESAQIGHDGDEVCITFAISIPQKQEILIYFPGFMDTPSNELLHLAHRTCSIITQLDNLVQDSCENDWRRSGFHVDNYDLYLAHIMIEATIVRLVYYGNKVNTSWDAVFAPSDDECWKKVNF